MTGDGAIRVTVGILEDSKGNVLLQRRQPGSPCPGKLEFPGGKVDPGEGPAEALARELVEETGVRATKIVPWVRRVHDYSHGRCDIDFMRVPEWKGEPAEKEGQQIEWTPKAGPVPANLLEANREVWKWLQLPIECMISSVESLGVGGFLNRWECAQRARPTMALVREKGLPVPERERVLEAAVKHKRRNSLVIFHGDLEMARRCGASGIHLDSGGLAATHSRPEIEWVGASCHDEKELELAGKLPVDYAFLSPVKRTQSHPDAKPLGWSRFAEMAGNCGIPVFAMGGLAPGDLGGALARGAHGIAAMRAYRGG